jgi:hypothetical protein
MLEGAGKIQKGNEPMWGDIKTLLDGEKQQWRIQFAD